jgi:hypothetical protein
MSQARKKGWLASLSTRTRIILGIVVIAVITILVVRYAPSEGDASNVTGDTVMATVTVTNLISTVQVNRSAAYSSTITVTVMQATQAKAFSDDRKRVGNYTIRVLLQLQGSNKQAGPLGLDYASLAGLVLPTGQVVAPKLVAMSPDILPNQMQNGYIDFPVTAPVDLGTLKFRLGSQMIVDFGR